MRCHQVLTGAVNSGDNTYSVGSVEGIRFTAYSSGCNIVILSPTFERVQIIPGVLNENVQVNCLDASTDVGKIAACYGGPIRSNQLVANDSFTATKAATANNNKNNRIMIFEPTPIVGKQSEHRLDYHWIKTAEIEPLSAVNVLSWNIEGTKLLIGGVKIQLWQFNQNNPEQHQFPCSLAPDEGLRMKPIKPSEPETSKWSKNWSCVWWCKTSAPVYHLSFSPDGSLFCSNGRADRLVKIWFQTTSARDEEQQMQMDNPAASFASLGVGQSEDGSNLSFGYIYIAHPRAVTGISWRQVSKYMVRGSVANMLVTSCRDNICRLWVQTLLPDDGLVNITQLDGVSSHVTPRSQTQRHRQKILQRFKHIRSFSNFRRKNHSHGDELNEHGAEHGGGGGHDNVQPIASLPSTFSSHDFHGFGVHGTSITPGGLHFHLTASINAENDIPLVPSLQQHHSESDLPAIAKMPPKVMVSNTEPRSNSPSLASGGRGAGARQQQQHRHHEESDKPLFIVQWLNNKEMTYTQNAERILHEIVTSIIEGEKRQQLQQQQQQQQQAEQNAQQDSESITSLGDSAADSVVAKTKKDVDPTTTSNNSSSTNSLATGAGAGSAPSSIPPMGVVENRRSVGDYLDRKLESLMREWHNTADLIYSIHPLDGSLLVWMVEWLDEPAPSTFRQPQISFSSRIPNSIPLFDASTMSYNISLFSPNCLLDLKTAMGALTGDAVNSNTSLAAAGADANKEEQHNLAVSLVHQAQQQQHQQQQPLFGLASIAAPTVCMVTKHNNGTLNLWNLVFGDKTNFTQVLNISHAKRVCGHRFRVNDVTCHPILPLLLTTSHHNLPNIKQQQQSKYAERHSPNTPDSTSFLVSPTVSVHEPVNNVGTGDTLPNTGFCSELILWKVDSVGPLLKSGGVSELARINSLEPTAFANVAWIPTLLPSTALGSISNSPSACFVASDGQQLRIFQAVIDARSLLGVAQKFMLSADDRRRRRGAGGGYDSSDEGDEEEEVYKPGKPKKSSHKRNEQEHFRNLFKIVSLQSTARPGCVLELGPIVDASHDWHNTQLLHVFQQQLILGTNAKAQGNSAANASDPTAATKTTAKEAEIIVEDGEFIDLNSSPVFEESFYLVVLEKTGTASTVHMWQIIISSQTKIDFETMGTPSVVIDEDEDDDDSSRSGSPLNFVSDGAIRSPPLRIKTRKVCTQVLPLDAGVEVIHASPCAGHLSSSNIYPACYAPFLLSTACSDNRIRFWKCDVGKGAADFTWVEWEMNLKCEPTPECFVSSTTTTTNGQRKDEMTSSSSLELPGSPLYVACAYSGRVAAAFKFGHSYVEGLEKMKGKSHDNADRFINIGISIFECQSSGGSEWILEDTIKIDRIPLLEMNSTALAGLSDIDIAPLVDTSMRNQMTSKTLTTRLSSNSLATLGSSNPFLDNMDGGHQFDHSHHQLEAPNIDRMANIQRLLAVPSYTTMQSLRQIIAEQGNQFTFFQKSPVLLDWVSTEDGFHILTCSAGHKIALFAPISQLPNVAKAPAKPKPLDQPIPSTPSASKKTLIPSMGASTTTAPAAATSVTPSNFRLNLLDPLNTVAVTKWMLLRMSELDSVDGLPPLPMQMSWVRDGILVVGMDNEMLIFTQWKMPAPNNCLPNMFEGSTTTIAATPATTATEAARAKKPMATRYPFDSVDLPMERVINILKEGAETGAEQAADSTADRKSATNIDRPNTNDKFISDMPEDFGLFEAFRHASPVIPQYHPRQLMELLAFGKIHRVRAILSHLVQSLISLNSVKEYLHHPANMQHASFDSERSPRSWTRTRALSVSAQHPQQQQPAESGGSPLDHGDNIPIVSEEIQLDYTEIAAIRPLPLYALINADEGISLEKKAKMLAEEQARQNKADFGLDPNEPLDPDSLFDFGYKTQVEETLDEFLGDRNIFNFSNVATSKFLKNQQQQQPELDDTGCHISINFDQRQAQLLTKLLTHSHLPGLTGLDQMHLLALADSLTSFDEVVGDADRQDDGAGIGINGEQQLTVTANSLDDCGLRYLLNMRQHIYLLKCLPLMQRKVLQRNGIGLHNIIWAYHSETQEELIQLLPAFNSPNVCWAELKEYGIGFWIRNNALLRKVVEKLAKATFKAKGDPLDASLYYLAMKKKNLVWGLYRSTGDKKMTDFFSHDFNDQKWRTAALKNAYVLMGKQRFEHAVSFFLLAGNLWDAVELCLNKLDDIQLAMIILRLFEGDLETVPESLKRLLHQEVLGYQPGGGGVQDMEHAHPDPFLRSMAYWTLQEYNLALSTLLEVDVGRKHFRVGEEALLAAATTTAARNYTTPLPPTGENNFEGLHPSVFNFYLYLRSQPLIVRRAQVAQQNIEIVTAASPLKRQKTLKAKKSHMFNMTSTNRFEAIAVTPFERRLFFLTAYRHLRAGCPSLALEILSRLPANIMTNSEKDKIEECSRRLSVPDESANAGGLLQSSPSSTTEIKKDTAADLFGGSSNFEWGAPSSSLFQSEPAEEEFKIKFDDDDEKDEDDDDDDDDGLQMKDVSESKDEPEVGGADPSAAAAATGPVEIDVMAQQFKFISCLKIMMEELSTLATGFEVDGGQLRYQLYIWLERSVQTLKEICNYHTFSVRSFQQRASFDDSSKGLMPEDAGNKMIGILLAGASQRKSSDYSTASASGGAALHEVLLADKEDFESKLVRCRRRKQWLIANEALLRNLLSFCSLHGAQGGLASVRMELILLLQELQQERTPHQQLASPLPLPTTLPLLTASVASQKTVVADPIKHLQSAIHDILATMANISTYVRIPNITAYNSSSPEYLALPPFMVSGTATNMTPWSALQDGPSQSTQSNSYVSTLYAMIHILRQLGISLSACVYQSLCDCDTVMQNMTLANQGENYRLGKAAAIGGKRDSIKKPSPTFKQVTRVTSNTLSTGGSGSAGGGAGPGFTSNEEEILVPNTAPNKWPGVQALQALIVRDKDEDLPKLHTLLCESFVAVYFSQLVYALTICDSSILYRLIGLDFSNKSWGELFGGGGKKLFYVSTATTTAAAAAAATAAGATNMVSSDTADALNGASPLLTQLNKQRTKLHMKIMEQLNQAGAAVVESVRDVGQGMVNVATSPSSTIQNISNIGNQIVSGVDIIGGGPPPPRPAPPTISMSTSLNVGGEMARPTYKEVFVPPQVSIVNYLMRKPKLPDEMSNLDYDSLGSDDEDETDTLANKFDTGLDANDDLEIDEEEYRQFAAGTSSKLGGTSNKVDKMAERRKENLEYELYAWCIMRLAVTRIASEQLHTFLRISGMELVDLPTTSPLIHSMMRTLARWQSSMQYYLNHFTNMPDHFLPNMYVDVDRPGPTIQKFKSLFEIGNTPFRRGYTSARSAKRLWHYLVRQPSVQELFVRYIFGKSTATKTARDVGARAVCVTSPGAVSHNAFDQSDATSGGGGGGATSNNTKIATTEMESDSTTGLSVDINAAGGATAAGINSAGVRRPPEAFQVVHKDQDMVSAFCISATNPGNIALATPKEIQELNIRPLLDSCVPWLEEETELDILNLRSRPDSNYVDYLLVHHPSDRLATSPGGQAMQRSTSVPAKNDTPTKTNVLSKHHFPGNTNIHFCRHIFERSRHLFIPLKRHKVETVRRLSAHPLLPLYLSGGQDGSVYLWEWNCQTQISTPRPPGTFAKVTHVQFNQQGNKFGVTDSEGNLSLWQVAATTSKPFFTYQCHNKTASDFTFLGSSSLLMTAGHSTDHRNVVLLDTLLPTKKCVVSTFAAHEHHGAAAITYAPLNQYVITGGKRGDVFIFDMRQRVQRDRFQAHESAVKCIAIDPSEDFFATGSADGDIKVWCLASSGAPRVPLHTFAGEHARSSLFRNVGVGVSHLYIDNCGRLFSCGADGSMKMRHIPTIECQPRMFYSPTSPTAQSFVFGPDTPTGHESRLNLTDFNTNGSVVNIY